MLKKLFEFKNFEKNFRFFAPFSFGCFVVFLLLAIPAIINSPFDYQQGNAVKIMYIHVPAAWMALLVYTLMAIFNLSGFIWKNPFFYLIAKSIALIGCAFTFITLATGSLWGKPIWGVWWVWDARLTSVLILLFLYLGYMILLDSFDDKAKGEKIAAIISIVGFINVPIIKFSVEYWNSLHQPSSIMRVGGIAIHQTMLTPLLLMFGVYFSYFVFLSLLRVRSEILIKKLRKNDLHRNR
ncbi:MAG: heme transporter HemC [Alphaproteobacteria bacterium RIFCSPLOWO2_01_FULL_40_26]|nr:MAG: heme transporter HemC [Alphaproteobacteria bacterium RIFCSPLOWO2_01_FULL_40_26]OFX09397.1 MAG: heme transporter HemC [Alphaproteobacteria bacterium RIFCSPLOWO2_02_FULL_40_19]